MLITNFAILHLKAAVLVLHVTCSCAYNATVTRCIVLRIDVIISEFFVVDLNLVIILKARRTIVVPTLKEQFAATR